MIELLKAAEVSPKRTESNPGKVSYGAAVRWSSSSCEGHRVFSFCHSILISLRISALMTDSRVSVLRDSRRFRPGLVLLSASIVCAYYCHLAMQSRESCLVQLSFF